MNLNKDAPAPPGKKCGNTASISNEIRERKPDKYGNPHPKREQCYINIVKTANPHKNLTEKIPKKFILPCAGAGVTADGGDNLVGVLWDDFKDHSCP